MGRMSAAAGLLAAAAVLTAQAAETGTAAAAAAEAAPAARLPLWEAGFFGVAGSQPAYPGSAQRVRSGIVLPFLVWRGQVLRAEQGGVGLRAARGASWELDVGAAGSFGSAPADNSARRGMPHLGTLAEAGPRLKWDGGEAPGGGRWRASLPLRAVIDVSHGLADRGWAFEPEIGWGTRRGDWGFGASLGWLLGDRRLADTFYGMAPAYATATRPAYEARAGLIATRLAFNAGRRLNEDWRFFAFARLDSGAGAANRASPLVERQHGAAFGLGLAWTGWRSAAAGTP